jgi:hypothetical protein
MSSSRRLEHVRTVALGTAEDVPVAGGGDEVQQHVHTVVAEAGVTLDTALLGKNVIVLPLEEPDYLGETAFKVSWVVTQGRVAVYLASLSIWSPKPGVSTMVREMRVPSSSSSAGSQYQAVARGYDGDGPTVTGEILTPSSTWAVFGSSESLCSSTCLPQSVFTNVVRPGHGCVSTASMQWMQTVSYLFLRHRRPSGRTGFPS